MEQEKVKKILNACIPDLEKLMKEDQGPYNRSFSYDGIDYLVFNEVGGHISIYLWALYDDSERNKIKDFACAAEQYLNKLSHEINK